MASSLAGMVFCMSGKLSKPQAEIKADIEALGGVVKGSVTQDVTHVVSNSGSGKKVEEAQSRGLTIVDEAWLAERTGTTTPVKKKQKTTEVTPMKSAPRGAQVSAERAASRLAGTIDAAAPGHLQGGTIVDDYDAMLNQTDIQKNSNKFIRVQLIQTATGVTLHKRWGRVGESGQQQQVGPMDFDSAVKEFSKYFRSKTGNAWHDRQNFVPKNGKYTLIEMEHDAGRAQQMISSVASVATPPPQAQQCRLHAATKAFVELIFDEDMFRSAMSDLDIDPARLPLGALSRPQVQRGRNVLERLEQILQTQGAAQQAVVEALSNEFYTEIPHSFGRQRPPPINSQDALDKKFDMLNTLDDIEIAQATLKEAHQQTAQAHPTDVNYAALEVDLTPVPPSPELQLIQTYLQATQGKTNPMVLQQVFRVNRHNDQSVNLPNRMLLWHGTRVAVVAAILKSGLRIMPHSGGRVGRGIYLADVHEKSASYTAPGRGKIIMFLVEAALGTPHDITQDHPNLTRAPPGSNSVVARGRIQPDPSLDRALTIDGNQVRVPQGIPSASSFPNSSFYHNEFLIYDESQHRIRYVLLFNAPAYSSY